MAIILDPEHSVSKMKKKYSKIVTVIVLYLVDDDNWSDGGLNCFAKVALVHVLDHRVHGALGHVHQVSLTKALFIKYKSTAAF